MPTFDKLPLRTDRLLMRPLRPDDLEAIYAIFSDPLVMKYWSSPPWNSTAQAEAMIARDVKSMDTGEQLRLGLTLPEGGALLGVCTLFSFNWDCRRAEIGYSLASFAWGKGLMHEALTALINYGFTTLNLNRLEADIDPKNLASANVLERLGFTQEGFLRERWIVAGEVSDTALYGLLQREWPLAVTSTSSH